MRRPALFACALALVVSFVITSCADAARPGSSPVVAKAALGRLKVVLKAPAGVAAAVKVGGRKHFRVSKPAAGTSYAKVVRTPAGRYVLKARPVRIGGHLYLPNKASRSLTLRARAKAVVSWRKVAMRRLTNGSSDSLEPALSADGRFVVFDTDLKGLGNIDIFVYDNATGAVRRITAGNNASFNPTISADGRTVAFESLASNLVAGDTNRQGDIFVYDMATRRTTRITNGNAPSDAPELSANGQLVAFSSSASNLAKRDSNGSDDVFLYDRVRRTTTLVSASATGGGAGNGISSDPAISADGSTVVFDSSASDLSKSDTNGQVDVFGYNVQKRSVTQLTSGTSYSISPSVSQTGRYVAFASLSRGFAPGTTAHVNVYLMDTATLAVRRVTNGNNDSGNPSISGDGRYVAFDSLASNLTGGDTNGRYDVFLYDNGSRVTRKATNGKDDSSSPRISLNGQLVAFSSVAQNLVAGDRNYAGDVFMWDR